MGFIDKLVGRIPIFFIGLGLIIATGSYRGQEGAFATMPLVGLGLAAFGILLFGGLQVVGN